MLYQLIAIKLKATVANAAAISSGTAAKANRSSDFSDHANTLNKGFVLTAPAKTLLLKFQI